MDERFESIVRGLIAAERGRREVPFAEALGRVTQVFAEKRAMGHGRYPIDLDLLAGREYELRAEKWLSTVRKIASEIDLAWTRENVRDVLHIIQTELYKDSNELVDALRQRLGGAEPRIGELDKAANRVRMQLPHELDLLAYAQDKTRIPIADQLTAPRYSAVQESWAKTRAFLHGVPPDCANAAKEAVSAVEQLARIVVNKPTLTLGQALKELKKSSRVPDRLLNGIEETWVWASQTPGVRHGSAAPPAVEVSTARFVVGQAEAAISLLLSLDGASGAKQ